VIETAESYRRERLSPVGLANARGRAQHVIVVMLENRSFDHMLGLLDHPRREAYETYFTDLYKDANPWTVHRPPGAPRSVAVSGDATALLARDPPHGHQSGLTQLNRAGDQFEMDGFVDAYATKLAGKEPHPKVRKRRAVPAAVGVAAVAGVGASEIAHHFDTGNRMRTFGVLALVVAGVAAIVDRVMFPGTRKWHKALATAAATLLAAAPLAAVHWGGHWRRLSWAMGGIGVAAVTGLAAWAWTKRSPPPPVGLDSAERVMACQMPENLPVLAALARRYALCVRWHSSVPGATWPNRHFAHAGTSDESVDIEVGFYDDPTIFQRLDEAETEWRIYHAGIPQVIAFSNLWRTPEQRQRWRSHEELIADVDAETLPAYAFVEPAHSGDLSNSQHPGNNDESSDDFYRAEQFIANLYRHLVDKPTLFEKTVLIVTYDEHGGLFDHFAPPAAVPPEPLGQRRRATTFGRRLVSWFVPIKTQPFTFAHLGVRVPTVVISPWVEEAKIDTTVYDHSSIPATLSRLFLDPRTSVGLGARVDAANDFAHLLLGNADADHTQAGVPPAGGPTYPPPEFGTAAGDSPVEAPPRSILADDLTAQLATLDGKVAEALRSATGDVTTLDVADTWQLWNSDIVVDVEPRRRSM